MTPSTAAIRNIITGERFFFLNFLNKNPNPNRLPARLPSIWPRLSAHHKAALPALSLRLKSCHSRRQKTRRRFSGNEGIIPGKSCCISFPHIFVFPVCKLRVSGYSGLRGLSDSESRPANVKRNPEKPGHIKKIFFRNPFLFFYKFIL